LCIVPHGPLHYVPFHLLEVNGRPLANDWVVTVLPNVRMLTTRPEKPKAGVALGGLSAFGLDYTAHPFHLGQLEEAVSEAESVARTAGGEALVNENATRAAFLAALQSRRFVHLAAHGCQNAVGPAFHVVYLAPDVDNDGRVFAVDLLGRDLRTLEL